MRTLAVLLVLLPLVAQAEVLTSATCTPGDTTGCFTRNTSGFASVFVDVSGTWQGTVVFESAGASSGPWRITRAYALDGSGSYVSSVSANGAWSVVTGGAPFFRVRASSLVSGAITVTAQASTFNVPADIVRVAGSDFGQPVVALTTPDGGLPVAVRGVVPVSAPDGGLPIAGPVSVTAPPGGLPVTIPDAVRVVGPTFGEVLVSGTVNLSSATLASMGNYVCSTSESRRLALGTTPVIVPTGAAMLNRTGWTLINQDGNKKVSCRVDPGDGGVPDCATPGFGITVQPNGGVLTLPIRASNTVRCVACTNGAVVEHTEEACVVP